MSVCRKAYEKKIENKNPNVAILGFFFFKGIEFFDIFKIFWITANKNANKYTFECDSWWLFFGKKFTIYLIELYILEIKIGD